MARWPWYGARLTIWGFAWLAVLLMGCAEDDAPGAPGTPGAPGDDAGAAGADRPVVYVVNYPLQYFAQRIGGDLIEVHFPAPRDVDPAYWRPDGDTILAYQQAELILLNGAGYARWIEHVSLPSAALYDTAQPFQDRLLEVPDAITHAHGPGGHVHTHAGTAFTTWLDPTLAIEHARAVTHALVDRLPDHRAELEQRFTELAQDFEALDEQIRDIVSEDPDRPLLASHPVYHYLEARYGLNLESLHWEPNEMPGDDEWAALASKLESHPAVWMLWEGEPSPEIASRLRAHGVAGVVYDPCAQPPAAGDLLSVMRDNVANLRIVFAAE